MRRFLTLLLLGLPMLAAADELFTVKLEAADGRFTPSKLVVPAGKKIKIEIHNTGKTPLEFESRELRKEKVLGPGSSSFVVIAPLSKGQYNFFDEFHQDIGQGTIVAQ